MKQTAEMWLIKLLICCFDNLSYTNQVMIFKQQHCPKFIVLVVVPEFWDS